MVIRPVLVLVRRRVRLLERRGDLCRTGSDGRLLPQTLFPPRDKEVCRDLRFVPVWKVGEVHLAGYGIVQLLVVSVYDEATSSLPVTVAEVHSPYVVGVPFGIDAVELLDLMSDGETPERIQK